MGSFTWTQPATHFPPLPQTWDDFARRRRGLGWPLGLEFISRLADPGDTRTAPLQKLPPFTAAPAPCTSTLAVHRLSS
jgi:hypothetical protein